MSDWSALTGRVSFYGLRVTWEVQGPTAQSPRKEILELVTLFPEIWTVSQPMMRLAYWG